MHDLAALEADGIAATFVASTEFVAATDAQSRALGFAAVPAVYVAHPIQDRTDAEMSALADEALPRVLAAVTGDAAGG
ncbi:hypothetical protein Acsp06_00540 [Actinomycetospora sp. NBRC 106375]|nr:hypothetical protein Acsp06_00540 [Actinomycetospora sp. NBRC 106375]